MKEDRVPPDQDARTAIETDLDRTLIVTAGPGSGKTRHLVKRVSKLLVSGRANVEQVAVITFSESAAAELRARLGAELEKVARDPAAHGGARRERAAAALAALDGAAVGTLHGFARRILAEHPFAAGLPARFEVLDKAGSVAELDERWKAALDALVTDDQGARSLQWCALAGVSLSTLRQLYRQLGGSWDRIVGSKGGATALPGIGVASVLDPLERARALLGVCTDTGDRLFTHLVGLEPYGAELSDAGATGNELETLGVLLDDSTKLRSGNRGKASAWSGHKTVVTGLLEEADEARKAEVAAAVGAALTTIGAILGRHAVADARRRVSAGRLEFHDLLVVARDLVRDHRDVRHALHERYTHLFVDEMQDTDPLQVELVTMIAASPEAEIDLSRRGSIPTVPGAEFFVGDPMQSIYAFRGADVTAFTDVIEQVNTPEVALTTNFRSVPGIVEWINAVFGALVGEGVPGLQPAYAPQEPFRDAVSGERDAVTVLRAGEEHPRSADKARALEAEELASVIDEMVRAGRPVGRGGRPVQFDDIAVLVPTRTSIRTLVEAFDARSIDYRLEQSSYVYAAAEVRDLFCVLRAIDDPLDQLSVLGALRSPGFGCGDDDLLRFRLAGGSWDFREMAPTGDGSGDPVVDALGRLRALSEGRVFVPVSELVARVVVELRQFEVSLDTRRWQEEWRRLRFVLDQARQFTESSAGGLHEYLRWIAVQSEEEAKVTEVVVPEAGTPAVTVMTVHAAKGLEFPVVAVLGFASTPRGVRNPAALFADGRLEIGIRGDRCTSGYTAAADHEKQRYLHERLRLFFVAVTRAENHLIVSVHRSTRTEQSSSVAARLEGVLDGVSGPKRAREPETRDRGARGRPSAAHEDRSKPGRAGSEASFEEWGADRARRFARPPRVVAATGVAKLLASLETAEHGRTAADAGDAIDEERLPDERLTDEPLDGAAFDAEARRRRGRGGTAFGRAVHAVLQSGDLVNAADFAVLAREHARAERIPDREHEVLTIARAAASSELVRRAVSGRYWRELYVGARVGERVLEGFVDLVFEGPDGLEIVDYKTDLVRDEREIELLAERYRLQAASYALGVEEATARAVARCTLLFVRPEEPVAREVLGLRGAVDEVRAALGGISHERVR